MLREMNMKRLFFASMRMPQPKMSKSEFLQIRCKITAFLANNDKQFQIIL